MKYIKELNIDFNNWDDINNDTIKFNNLYKKIKVGDKILAIINNKQQIWYSIELKKNKRLLIKNHNDYYIIDKYSNIQIYDIKNIKMPWRPNPIIL